MTAPAFTAGPWRAITNGPFSHAIVESDNLTIANGIVSQANAGLIAAAPRLYEAVKRVDALLRDIEDVCLAMPHARRPRWFRGVQDMIAVTDGALRAAAVAP